MKTKLTLNEARELIAAERAANGGMPVEIRRHRSARYFASANYAVWCRRPAHDDWECHGHYRSAADAVPAALELAEIEVAAAE